MKQLTPAIGGGILVALLTLLRIWDPILLQDLRHRVFDTYQRVNPRPYQPAPVRIIDIDSESLNRIGQWPWSRNIIAQLVDRTGKAGAAAIVLDMVFAEPDRLSPSRILAEDPALGTLLDLRQNSVLPDYDQQLASTISQYPVVGGFALSRTSDDRKPLSDYIAFTGVRPHPAVPAYAGAIVNVPVLERSLTGNGSFTAERRDHDAVVRRIPMIFRKGEQLLPSLSVEALRVSNAAQTTVLRSSKIQNQVELERLRVGQYEIPLTANGEIWVHYTETVPERSMPAWQLLQADADGQPNEIDFTGQTVLIGTSAVGLGDFANTALGTTLPGVEIHALALEQMMLDWFLERPTSAAALETLSLIVLGLVLVFLIARLGPIWGAGAVLTIALMAITVSWLMFTQRRLLFDPVFPVLSMFLIYFSMSIWSYGRAQRIHRQLRRAFSTYLAPELLRQLELNPEKLRLGGESRELTLLFTDIAGFTRLSESTSPDKLVPMLNEYLNDACEIVIQHGGYIDKIIGDAVFAIFNAPSAQPDHAQRGVDCALALDQFARQYSAEMQNKNIPFGKTRIGVNTGYVTVGNFGGNRRFDYTAFGDAVNTAARLESANKLLGTNICIAATTVELCQHTSFRPIGTLFLRGKSVGVETFEPLPENTIVESPHIIQYEAAYCLLKNADGQAHAAFQTLLDDYPEDPLILLHTRRLNEGRTGTAIEIS